MNFYQSKIYSIPSNSSFPFSNTLLKIINKNKHKFYVIIIYYYFYSLLKEKRIFYLLLISYKEIIWNFIITFKLNVYVFSKKKNDNFKKFMILTKSK